MSSFNINRPFGTRSAEGGATGGDADEMQGRWGAFVVDLERKCNNEGSGESKNEEHRVVNNAMQADASQNVNSINGDAWEEAEGEDDSNVPDDRSFGGRALAINSLYMQRVLGKGVAGGGATNSPPDERRPVEPLPSTLRLDDWIAFHKRNSGSQAKVIDKKYLEDAALVGLSMARALSEYSTVEIATANVIVSDTKFGEVKFVDLDTATPSESSYGQRRAIFALGRVYYEMLTQGLSPPPSSEQESTFDVALNISQDDDVGDDDDAGEQENKRKQPRGMFGQAVHCHYYASLEIAGVPPSLCRLVSNMLENDNASGGLFCSDEAVASLSDVIDDLQHMVDDPASYLHDALIFRLEPTIPDNELYGRVDELSQIMGVAKAIPFPENSASALEQAQSAIIISGFPGCGKSSLVKEVERRLRKDGWQCLQCKFDEQAQMQPLSAIASAFDRLLLDIGRSLDLGRRNGIGDRINCLLDDDDIDALCQLIPALRQLMTIENTIRCESKKEKDLFGDVSDAQVSKFRLHRVFGLLVKALSEPKSPLLICTDDIQWADSATLDLINSLVDGTVGDDELPMPMRNEGSCTLFIGCYRMNDTTASASQPLANCIKKMQDCNSIALEEIQLEGLLRDDVNALVSEALCYPQRLTRSLATLIHQKTAGNPLFVKEFLDSLATENLLKYSLSSHRWRWDEEVIEMKAVANGVVDLLTSRLEKLPEGVLSTLRVMSCFGHEVALDIMAYVANLCGEGEVTAALEHARDELLIRKFSHRQQSVYSFAHDMIQNTVYGGINGEDRAQMMKEIADILIVKTSGERSDAILFTIVGLINRVSPRNVQDAADRIRYAKLNLLAGEKSIHAPDFSSALSFIEHGISFLEDGYWEHEYCLSLSLFKTGAGVAYSLGKSHQMTNYLNEVSMCNARNEISVIG